ncbi:MAG: hypothetical protein E6713_15385, partial [Sporomusaceae bacterium]|nr:hypothetical protein [Sporomusaceae bacterium]
ILTAFYEYLASRHLLYDWQDILTASQEIAGGEELHCHKTIFDGISALEGEENFSALEQKPQTEEEFAYRITAAVESLMNKLGTYFQQNMFMNDFERALFLYAGPFESVPEEEYHEFWLGFWDYFLFDYHLLDSDATPLRFFTKGKNLNLSREEKQLLQELLKARYTVFYISRIIDENFVECVNLFTEEVFRLPQPDFEYKKIKKLLFFGHVFSGEMTLINYVASIEVSPNLKRRIKEEIIRQKDIFTIKQPDATWDDFFARHALNIKYTVDVLLSLAKVNVTPFQILQRQYKQSELPARQDGVSDSIKRILPAYGFSLYDISMAQKLWADYAHFSVAKVRDERLWAAAVAYVYSKMNGHKRIMATRLADELEQTSASIYACANKIKKVLELEEFDPRYLSEEGFVFLLLKS